MYVAHDIKDLHNNDFVKWDLFAKNCEHAFDNLGEKMENMFGVL